MSADIKFWFEYAGGMDLLWLIMFTIAATQFLKISFKAFEIYNPAMIRPVPYAVGAMAGLEFIDYSIHGAMIGFAAGMVSSLFFFGFLAYLERKDSPAWQRKVAMFVSMKQ